MPAAKKSTFRRSTSKTRSSAKGIGRVGKVMHEYKLGTLKSGKGGIGGKVKSRNRLWPSVSARRGRQGRRSRAKERRVLDRKASAVRAHLAGSPTEAPATPGNLIAGAKLYREFCAVCRGMSGAPPTPDYCRRVSAHYRLLRPPPSPTGVSSNSCAEPTLDGSFRRQAACWNINGPGSNGAGSIAACYDLADAPKSGDFWPDPDRR